MANEDKAFNTMFDPDDLTGKVQRAICTAGNVNTSFSIECQKAILVKVVPKLANFAPAEVVRRPTHAVW